MRASYPMTRYFLAVGTRADVLVAVSAGFCFAGAEKAALLSRMAEGDWLAYYSPRESPRAAALCRRFTAIGRVTKGRVSGGQGSESFGGARRPMRYLQCHAAPAAALVASLSFVRDPRRWGSSFREGFFEVAREDFAVIAQAMLTRVEWETL
jgi:EVE domain